MKKNKNKHGIKNTKTAKIKKEKKPVILVKHADAAADTKAQIVIQNKIDYTPKVSVIIPVYNVAEYLRECLDSVINQTLKEIEIICVDDGSTDNSLEILKEYADKDKRITVISRENKGVGFSRNEGIQNSKGEFIAFMDPDDFYPDLSVLNNMYNATVTHHVNISGGSLIVYDEKRKKRIEKKEPLEFFPKDQLYSYTDFQYDYGFQRYIYNRKLIVNNQIFFPNYRRFQDPPFMVKAFAKAGKFYALHQYVYAYRWAHKAINWTEEKVFHLLSGLRDDLLIAKHNGLTKQFVIKCNHGSGWNIIVKDKAQLDLKKTKILLDQWMADNFAFHAGFELQYRDIVPKIIIEQYLTNDNKNLYDYKFWCFNGKVKYMQFRNDFSNNLQMVFYDLNWNRQSFSYDHPIYDKELTKPDNFQEMINIAKKLCQGFPFVCVDLYRLNNGTIKFGEMTFTRSSGLAHWNNESVNLMLGAMIKLPSLAYNINTGQYYKLPKIKTTSPYLIFPYNLYRKAYFMWQKKCFYLSLIQKTLLNCRIDIKNVGNAQNAIIIKSSGKIYKPVWFYNNQGQGQVVEANTQRHVISIKVLQEGILILRFRGQDKRFEGNRIPLWIDYTSIKINGKEILSTPIEAWHDKPFRYEMPVKDGQTVLVEIVQQPHKYSREELKDTILKLFPNNEYIKKNISSLIKSCFMFLKHEKQKPSRLFSITKAGAKKTVYILGIKLEFNNKQKELLLALQQNQQTLLQAVNTITRRSDQLEQQNIALSQQVNIVDRELQQAKLWLKQTYEMFPALNKQLAKAQETLLSQLVTERKVNRLAAIVSMEIKRQRKHHKEIEALLSKFISSIQTDLRYLKNLDVVKSKHLHQTAEELTQCVLSVAEKQEKSLASTSQFSNLLETLQKNNQNEQEAIKKHLHIIQNKALQQYNELNFADLLHDSTQNTPWLKDKTLSLYGWAANYSFIYTLFRILDKVSPLHILEMGLGQTTRLTSQYIAYKNPNATLDVCEHNQDWIDIYVPELPKSSNIKVHHLDLEYFDHDGKKNDKYKNLAQVTGNIKYNLIIVDGPVGGGKNFPRSNIIDLIPQNLAKDFIIIFDDAERAGEQNTIAQTKAKLSAQGIAFGTQQRNALKSQFLIFSKSCEFVQYL